MMQTSRDGPDVHMIEHTHHLIIDNGIMQVTLSKPGGIVTGIQYGGLDNLLEGLNKETNRGYWDLVWNTPEGSGIFDVIEGTQCEVVDQSTDKIEISFKRTYNPSETMVPLNIDKRFVVLRGVSGFYSYAIYEHEAGWPDFDLVETRIAFKLRKDRFQYMAVADNKQRVMPFPEDREPGRCQPLAYPEAVLLTRPKNPLLQGEVDDKYQYSCDNRKNRVHGWISLNPPMVGFWVITPSDEFRNGGVVKQNLTSHVGPTSLAMFHSGHYAGEPLFPKFRNGEAWRKVFGPVLIYLNSAPPKEELSYLWENAKEQMFNEVQSWPYDFPSSQDYLKRDERGTVTGRLFVQDSFATSAAAGFAYVGLALPGESGSWQIESKGYQFWTQADENGNFTIQNVRSGVYNLFGWVTGVLGDYKKEDIITIQPGSQTDLGDLTFMPPRDGRTLWEIGIPDRTAAEFFVPDPDPKFINRILVDTPEKYRQYGLWLRYSEIYPENDLIYKVGESDWSKDWFFAHVGRIKDDGSLQPTTWQIIFDLATVRQSGLYKLRIAFAAANLAIIQVRFNDPNVTPPHFDSGRFGRDNAIARHGIHGLYYLFHIDVSPKWLHEGRNTVYLTQNNVPNLFAGVMYDYLRLEEPMEEFKKEV